jgi:hypothetical protein
VFLELLPEHAAFVNFFMRICLVLSLSALAAPLVGCVDEKGSVTHPPITETIEAQPEPIAPIDRTDQRRAR